MKRVCLDDQTPIPIEGLVPRDLEEPENKEFTTEAPSAEQISQTKSTGDLQAIASNITTTNNQMKYNPLVYLMKDIPKEAPPNEQFLLPFSTLPAMDLDIIRLTAQYTALHGKDV